MDGILTNFAEALLLKHLCGVEAHTPKVQTFAALFTDDPTEAGNMVEPADAAYARVALNSAAWSTPAGRAIRNVGAVTFPEPTVQWAITHVGIVDAATAGNLTPRAAPRAQGGADREGALNRRERADPR